jgi:hypothetical protein
MSPQAMQMVERGVSVDPAALARDRGNPPIERLPELGDDERPVAGCLPDRLEYLVVARCRLSGRADSAADVAQRRNLTRRKNVAQTPILRIAGFSDTPGTECAPPIGACILNIKPKSRSCGQTSAKKLNTIAVHIVCSAKAH